MTLEAASAVATRIAAILGVAAFFVSSVVFMAYDSTAVRNYIRDRAGTDVLAQEINGRLTAIELQLSGQIERLAADFTSVSRSLETATTTLNATAQTVNNLVNEAHTRRAVSEEAIKPCLQWEQSGHEVSDAAPGGLVRIKVAFRKLRECGFAEHGVWIRNGDAQYHACQEISWADQHGRMYPIKPDPHDVTEIVFTCRIPDNEGIHTGRAHLWVLPYYQGAPEARHNPSPEIPFTVLSPAPEQDLNQDETPLPEAHPDEES